MHYITRWGKPKFFGRFESKRKFNVGQKIIIKTERGQELAVIVGEIDDIDRYYDVPVVEFVRTATPSDLRKKEEFSQKEEYALKVAKELAKKHQLDMKVIDAEYLIDNSKLYFYFTSAGRVDFRQMVRDLAREFKIRIELRQIGARDEAKIIGGIGPCGFQCCCDVFIVEFQSINMKMIKYQNLVMNPSKTSGICGKLMCCMKHEYPQYMEVWNKLPEGVGPDYKIKTEKGNYVVAGVDIVRECVRIIHPEGKELWIPIEDFKAFEEHILAGGEWEAKITKVATPVEEGEWDSSIEEDQ